MLTFDPSCERRNVQEECCRSDVWSLGAPNPNVTKYPNVKERMTSKTEEFHYQPLWYTQKAGSLFRTHTPLYPNTWSLRREKKSKEIIFSAELSREKMLRTLLTIKMEEVEHIYPPKPVFTWNVFVPPPFLLLRSSIR